VRVSATLVLCPVIFLLGCGGTLEKPVDPGQGAEVLNTALEAWKAGEEYRALEQRDPPIHFYEKEWEAGKKLVSFEAGPVTLMGRQGRSSVKLTLQDKTGKVTERVIGYQIDTTPNIVITREAMGP
jgi:hypothetical protein